MFSDPQNPIITENSIPTSPQEPIEQVPEITPIPTTPEVPPEALESSPNDFTPKSDNIAPSDLAPENSINNQISEKEYFMKKSNE